MKKSLNFIFLFIASAFIFSNLTGCAKTTNAPADTSGANNSTTVANAEKSPNSSGLRVAPPALANAELELLDGSKITIADRKDKVILLNLWGIWCGPCRAEMPELIKMQEELGGKGFHIIGLNIGDQDNNPEDVGKIQQFKEKMGLNYELARIDTNATEQMMRFSKFTGVPQSYLIDRNGNIRGVFGGGSKKVLDQMRETIEKVIAE